MPNFTVVELCHVRDKYKGHIATIACMEIKKAFGIQIDKEVINSRGQCICIPSQSSKPLLNYAYGYLCALFSISFSKILTEFQAKIETIGVCICFYYRSDNLKHAKPKGVQLIEF